VKSDHSEVRGGVGLLQRRP